ncbi:Hypothetical predicted protein [Podarcis lilfordi]|uniref:Uncharacterized protein n=1 Tax=Podarcis lilfordi TaxID=74358 RepID=A0AA35K3Q8_9SAUR|nr:Hypothetical predicted protein [Podarcis lilfordi]
MTEKRQISTAEHIFINLYLCIILENKQKYTKTNNHDHFYLADGGKHGAELGAALGALREVGGAAGLRFGGAGGLAGEQGAQALPRLAEEAAAGPAGGHAEEAGPGVRQPGANGSKRKPLDQI